MLQALDTQLVAEDARLPERYPGDSPSRQPVHTVYVPADQLRPGLCADWGRRALRCVDDHAPDAETLATALGLNHAAVTDALPLVRDKLRTEPVEDLRIDFEDGYGTRSDREEDGHVLASARALLADMRAGQAPPFVGLRPKGMEAAGRHRGVRTLTMFLEEVLAGADRLPDGLRITLPKITSVRQVEAMAWLTERLEKRLGLPEGVLGFELQIETTQSILDTDGTTAVSRMIHAGGGGAANGGRVTALHFGTYDYSAACGVTAAYQSMAHPAADHAKAVMQVAAAGTGVWLSDGSTNILPVGSTEAVHAAWRTHSDLVRRSLERAFYQGWDLHPHQLPTRYLATYVFFRDAFPRAAERLRTYLAGDGSGVIDEPATAQALAAGLLRGLRCGALTEDEVTSATGATLTDLTTLASRRVG
ncbi:aldolase [Spiractinospora alimapuensis]|nr:aldolase [Spiractinospora alimapuensis]